MLGRNDFFSANLFEFFLLLLKNLLARSNLLFQVFHFLLNEFLDCLVSGFLELLDLCDQGVLFFNNCLRSLLYLCCKVFLFNIKSQLFDINTCLLDLSIFNFDGFLQLNNFQLAILLLFDLFLNSPIDLFDFCWILLNLELIFGLNELFGAGRDFIRLDHNSALSISLFVFELSDDSLFHHLLRSDLVQNLSLDCDLVLDCFNFGFFIQNNLLASKSFLFRLHDIDCLFHFDNLSLAGLNCCFFLLDGFLDLFAFSLNYYTFLFCHLDGVCTDRVESVILEFLDLLDVILHAVNFSVLILDLFLFSADEFINLLSVEDFHVFAESMAIDQLVLFAKVVRWVSRHFLARFLSRNSESFDTSEAWVGSLIFGTFYFTSLAVSELDTSFSLIEGFSF